MQPKYGEFVGVDNLHYAVITQDDQEGYLAATPLYLAPSAEIAGEAETANTPTYYDNKPGFNYVSEGITTLTITVSNIPAELMATLLGKKYDPVSGRVYDSGQPVPPQVAVGFRYNVGPNQHRYYWYLSGTFSGGAEEAATKTGDVDIRTYQLTFTAVATTHEWLIDGESKSLKRVFGDTSDGAFNGAGWFAQVQTPDTSSAPTALALVSTSPEDADDDVATSTAIVLTFSNRIAAESVTVIGPSGVVPVTKVWNAGGTVLTLTPGAALSPASQYVVAVSGVRDVYGQQLAATSTTFETA